MSAARCVWWVWVWLGGTLLLLVPNELFRLLWPVGLGTLLGPEGTPVGVFLVPLLAGWSNACVCAWWLSWCWGVVVC